MASSLAAVEQRVLGGLSLYQTLLELRQRVQQGMQRVPVSGTACREAVDVPAVVLEVLQQGMAAAVQSRGAGGGVNFKENIAASGVTVQDLFFAEV